MDKWINKINKKMKTADKRKHHFTCYFHSLSTKADCAHIQNARNATTLTVTAFDF